MNANQLRAQAADCFRAALDCSDPIVAGELIEIGWALREEAELLECRSCRTIDSDIRVPASALH